MGAFESVFEDLDVKTEEMNGAMDNMYGQSIDNGEVTQLLQQMAAENGMALGAEMQGAGTGAIGNPNQAQNAQGVDEMQQKIN